MGTLYQLPHADPPGKNPIYGELGKLLLFFRRRKKIDWNTHTDPAIEDLDWLDRLGDGDGDENG